MSPASEMSLSEVQTSESGEGPMPVALSNDRETPMGNCSSPNAYDYLLFCRATARQVPGLARGCLLLAGAMELMGDRPG